MKLKKKQLTGRKYCIEGTTRLFIYPLGTPYMPLLSIRDSIMIELFYFDDYFRHIALWVSASMHTHSCISGGPRF